jgi:ribosome biogenesis GTPase
LQYSSTETKLPLVGDWVAVQLVDECQAVIHAVVERRTIFSRAVTDGTKNAAGRESPLAANLDVLAIVTGLDGNFNPRRAQRLATLARHGGVKPLWILNKADLPGSDLKVDQARRAAGIDPVVVLSSWTGEGLEALVPWMTPGTTLALAGSSGVGKTTLVNRLLEASLATQSVRRSDSKGQHTTTSRHLYGLPGGALLMDTPGFRAVGLWADADDLAEGFADIEALACSCKFHDCRHGDEPGCAVRAALEVGTLDEARWEGWRRQEREVRYLDQRTDKVAQRAEKDRWKAIHQSMKGFTKETRSGR